MKLLPEMLAEWVHTDLTPEEIGDLLTMTGFELEEILEVEDEPVLDVNIMANRGDGASVLGLAREVNAKIGGATELFRTSSRRFLAIEGRPSIAGVDDRCDRFALLDVPEVENGPSPEWLQRRLRRMGQRPISLLVDLTNYVMLEVGQPLHAYDVDRLETGVFGVLPADKGETLRTLDGVDRTMRGGELLVREGLGKGRPVGLAGIMGGESTQVHAGTTRAVIEAAHFDAVSVRATRKAHGLFTEASYRFERSVDPMLVSLGLERFADLFQRITGRALEAHGFSDYFGPVDTENHHVIVSLRPERASRLLGYEVDEPLCRTILADLGFEILGPEARYPNDPAPAIVETARRAGGFAVGVPSWRYDVRTETDLVEEIGRIHGYEHIPAILPQGTAQPGGRQGYEAWRQRVLDAAIAEGLGQIVGHSLVPEDALGVANAAIGPRVYASPELQFLRTSLWTSLGMAARKASPGAGAHLFEIGRTFTGVAALESYLEHEELGLLSFGPLNPPGLRGVGEDRADFATLKGALDRILRRVGVTTSYTPSELSRLHPTRQAHLMVDGRAEAVGEIGQIHPHVAAQTGLPADTMLASLDLRAAYQAVEEGRTYRAFARTPGIRRDLAIVADRDLAFAEIERAIRAAAGEPLERLWVFDLYEGPNVGEGKKSVGVAIELRKPGATFTDEEANRVRDAIAAGLEGIGASLRV